MKALVIIAHEIYHFSFDFVVCGERETYIKYEFVDGILEVMNKIGWWSNNIRDPSAVDQKKKRKQEVHPTNKTLLTDSLFYNMLLSLIDIHYK